LRAKRANIAYILAVDGAALPAVVVDEPDGST